MKFSQITGKMKGNLLSCFAGILILNTVIVSVKAKITDGTEDISTLNLAEDYDEDYPIVFNILLWLGISLTIATIAISTFIASMDPGRDSLIYRVTSAQRFKKDN